MGKTNDFVKNNSEIAIILTITGVIILLLITIPLSGYIGNRIGINSQKKPLDVDFDSITDINKIFDGFKANIYNSSSTDTIYCEYSLDYYSSNYTSIGYFKDYFPNDPDNCYKESFIIHSQFQSNCKFHDITFVLSTINGIDYSKLNVVVYGDGEFIYCNSNIKSDFSIEFSPTVTEITIMVF